MIFILSSIGKYILRYFAEHDIIIMLKCPDVCLNSFHINQIPTAKTVINTAGFIKIMLTKKLKINS